MKLTLSRPPSVNSYWRFTSKPYPHWYIAPKGAKWLETAMWEMKSKRRGRTIKGDVEVAIDLYKTRRGADLDNVCKAICDAFEKSGVIENDSQIASLILNRYYVKTMKEERVEIELR